MKATNLNSQDMNSETLNTWFLLDNSADYDGCGEAV